jgi:hypothetical protein
MRSIVVGSFLTIAVVLWGVLAATAGPVTPTAGDYAIGLAEQVQYGGGYCERLRRACEFKYERGQEGEGNCRRYRRECGEVSYCERLRRACVLKYERGEEGEGNCRRYRRECR